MRSRWNLPVYLVYTVLCLLTIGYIVSQMGLTAPWQHPYKVTAVFRSAAGVLANNEVFMNGTRVGRIDSVDAQSGTAVVRMQIDDGYALPLHNDAQAMVRIKNLLGETYVELVRGSAATGDRDSGSTIDVHHTITPVEIDQVLAVLDPETRDRLKLIINGAGDALTNRGDNLNAQAPIVKGLATSLNGPATELAVRQQQLDDIVLELQRFYDVLARQRDQVRDEFSTWNTVMAQMAAQEQAIGGTLQQADLLLQNLDTLVTGEVPNIRATLDTLPTALANAQTFMPLTNTILGALAPIRRSIHDVFPNLGTSFADTTTDPKTGQAQHLWSVYSVNCSGPGSPCSTTTGYDPSGGGSSGADIWSAIGGTAP